jgi:hypothetical protein
MGSQGEDRTGGAPLQYCCTEWITKERIDLVEHLLRTAIQNKFSRRGQNKWRTSSGLLHKTDSRSEDRPSGALFQDCYTLWSLPVRIQITDPDPGLKLSSNLENL